jgi:hypothetical protein
MRYNYRNVNKTPLLKNFFLCKISSALFIQSTFFDLTN